MYLILPKDQRKITETPVFVNSVIWYDLEMVYPF